MVCYAVTLLPIKENAFQAMNVIHPSKWQNFLMTLIIVLVTTSCSWLYKEVTSWLQLIGSFTCGYLAFTMPGNFFSFLSFFSAICYVAGHRGQVQFRCKSAIALIFGVVMSVVCFVSTGVLVLVVTGVLKI